MEMVRFWLSKGVDLFDHLRSNAMLMEFNLSIVFPPLCWRCSPIGFNLVLQLSLKWQGYGWTAVKSSSKLPVFACDYCDALNRNHLSQHLASKYELVLVSIYYLLIDRQPSVYPHLVLFEAIRFKTLGRLRTPQKFRYNKFNWRFILYTFSIAY